MLLNHVAKGYFSAIAASFNPAVERDGAKALSPALLRWASESPASYI